MLRKLGLAAFGLLTVGVLLTWAAARVGSASTRAGASRQRGFAPSCRFARRPRRYARQQRGSASGSPSRSCSATCTSTPPSRSTPSCSASRRSGRGRASAGRRLRLRALLLGARLLVDQRPRRGHHAARTGARRSSRSASATRWRAIPANPDTVAFLGWEWTQVGTTPADHYGHKNVVLARHRRGAHPDAPDRRARAPPRRGRSPLRARAARRCSTGGRLHDFARYLAERAAVPVCDPDVHVRELPADCIESAATPEVLFHKLDEWGHEAMVIPHGTTWGFYTPPGSAWDKQLAGRSTIPSGRRWSRSTRATATPRSTATGARSSSTPRARRICPEPRPDYLPTCWRAGEIIRARCQAAGAERGGVRAPRASRRARTRPRAGWPAHRTVPGARGADWLDAGQCRDCLKPAFNYRPGGSAQYMLALGNFDDAGALRAASASASSARATTTTRGRARATRSSHRRGITESLGTVGRASGPIARMLQPPLEEPTPRVAPLHGRAAPASRSSRPSGRPRSSRPAGSSRCTPRAAIATRSGRRSSASEVYGTSGQRILLWFDLLNAPGSSGAHAADGRRGRDERGAHLPGARGRLLRAEAGLPGRTRLGALGAERSSASARASATTRRTSGA